VNDNVPFHIRFESEGFGALRDEAAEGFFIVHGDLLIELIMMRVRGGDFGIFILES